jgi:hypothetical protein
MRLVESNNLTSKPFSNSSQPAGQEDRPGLSSPTELKSKVAVEVGLDATKGCACGCRSGEEVQRTKASVLSKTVAAARRVVVHSLLSGERVGRQRASGRADRRAGVSKSVSFEPDAAKFRHLTGGRSAT